MTDTTTAAPPPAVGSVPRRSSGFVPFGTLRRRQEILSAHLTPLWQEIESKWIASARPIDQHQLDASGDYQRNHLSHVLSVLDEWDGYAICATLALCYGWRPDAALVAIVHRWSCGLIGAINAAKAAARRHPE